MFEAVELGQSLDRDEYKQRIAALRTDLLHQQLKLRDEKVATVIIIAGVEGAGKGEVVDQLYNWLDARGLETHIFWDITDEEKQRPWLWRFWRRMPARGEIAIQFGGWYWDPIYQHAKDEIDDAALEDAGRRIRDLEFMLQQDGLQIIKLWFHLSKDKHKQRMKRRREVMSHVRDGVQLARPVKYKKFLCSAEQMLRYTDSSENPWILIEADDDHFRDASVAQAINNSFSRRLSEQRDHDRRSELHDQSIRIEDHAVTVLDAIDLDQSLSDKKYDEQLKRYQKRLHALAWQAYDARRSVVMVFEGWDAAGKGGAIRRLTSAMDARVYRVRSIAAPTEEEFSHHYLWRFWRHLPRDGYMTLYDRSWYGRVLVERVEGFADPHEWRRAYHEINDFEEALVNHGAIVLKFWLHIDQEIQLKRFKDRKRVAWKQYKITEEDWRNREKWDAYKKAVNTMVTHTSTHFAPWHVIAANDKQFARVEVIKTVCEQLEAALERK